MTCSQIIGKALGGLWLIDGLLQLQPKMFGMDFTHDVLAPNLSNQPAWLDACIALGIRLFSFNIVFANLAVVLVQVGIGILLLLPLDSKQLRLGLYLSIIWGLVVWIFGEGLGNLLTGSASLYTGAPGAALLYAIIAGCLLKGEKNSSRLLTQAAAGILILGAVLQFQKVFWAADTMPMMAMGAMDPVHAISLFPTVLSTFLFVHTFSANIIFIIMPLGLGVGLLLRPNRMMAGLTCLFLFFLWWLGQDFGGLSTVWVGTATDPGTAPLMMLLVVPAFLGWVVDKNRMVAKQDTAESS